MKALIINGSPNKNGETVSMINYILSKYSGEYKIVNTYYVSVSPCTDCRACSTEDKCAIDDDMTEIYEYMRICDRIIFASPLYFSQFTGSFLSLMSRIQLFCSRKYIRNMDNNLKEKKGLILLNGGGSTVNTTGVEQCGRILMKEMNVSEYKTVCYVGTDKRSVLEDKKTVDELEKAANFFNET